MSDQKSNPVYSDNAVEWLRAEYSQRRARNVLYSLRSFARHLSIPSGPLSEILAKKRGLTLKQSLRIAERLHYSPKERELFLRAVAQSRQDSVPNSYQEIAADTFQLVSDWYHYAIRELMRTHDFKYDTKWIAKRLGISRIEAQSALERLSRLGLVKKVRYRWVNTGGITTTHDIPSRAIRQFHQQSLGKVVNAIDEIPVENRDVTSMTMAINVSKLPQAKKKIKEFRRQMARLLDKGQKTEVFQLNIQLVPLTRNGAPK